MDKYIYNSKMSFKSSPKCKASEIKCKQTGKSALLIICGEQITISKYNSKTNKADNIIAVEIFSFTVTGREV